MKLAFIGLGVMGFPMAGHLVSCGHDVTVYNRTSSKSTNIFSHEGGHLWHTVLGWQTNPHFDPLHILSNVLILGGILMLAGAWRVLHQAQASAELATDGLYARVRHPQYAAFLIIMFGYLLQWPTLLTLTMLPILVVVYLRLARLEEARLDADFGERYRAYAARTPAFIPKLGAQTRPEWTR